VNSPFRHAKKKELSLGEAIEACIRNNNRAKEYIYKRYYGYLIAVILRYVKDDYEAEELVNESFMRVFKGMAGFNARGGDVMQLEKPFLAWMGRIAANLSIDHLRAKKQFSLMESTEEFEVVLDSVHPSTGLEVAEILRLLDQLPDIQRAIFNLYEVEGYSHEEIAKRLGVPESTCRTYLTRAKKKLRALYLNLNKG